jgi:hypothetical protein
MVPQLVACCNINVGDGAKDAFFRAIFIYFLYKNEHFTKTGSGQT